MNGHTISEPLQQRIQFPGDEHLSDYFQILWRRKWVIIILLSVVLSSVMVKTLMTPATYKSTAKIIIEKQSFPVNGLEERTLRLSSTEDFFQTQYNLLESRSLAVRVIQKLRLWETLGYDPPIPSEADTSKTEELHDQLSAPAASNSSGLNPQVGSSVVNWYLSNLEIEPVIGTYLVNVSFKGNSPELITQIVNTHSALAIESSLEMEQLAAKQALNYIDGQIENQKIEVENIQHEIQDYKKKNDIISLQHHENIVSSEISELNSALTKAMANRIAKQNIYNQLEKFSVQDENLLPLPEFNDDVIIQRLRTKLVELKAKHYEMGTRFGPKHPTIIQIKSGIKQLEHEINLEIDSLKKTVKAELDRAKELESSLRNSLKIQERKEIDLGEKYIDYEVLTQKANSSQSIYDILLKHSGEVNLIKGKKLSNIRIVDEAEIPRFPIEPKIIINFLVAVVLSIFIGTALAFFIEYMDNTIKTPEDVIRRLKIPFLGMLPYKKSLNAKRLSLPWKDETEKLTENNFSYPLYGISRHLPVKHSKGEFDSMESDTTGKVLVVESATMNEGKTTVLTKLAMDLSASGLRVLALDFDLYRPSLHRIFEINNDTGLINIFEEILSYKLDSGMLKNCSVEDLFFLIALKKLTGALSVKNDSQIMSAYFQNGRLFHLQDINAPFSSRLGNMLLNGGSITKDQLKDALERQKRTSQSLGYILINAGYVSRDKLQGPLKLQMEEHLQKLFSWKDGVYEFNPGRLNTFESERVTFGEDYKPIINTLCRIEGNRLLEHKIFSRIVSTHNGNLFVLPAGITGVKNRLSVNYTLMSKILEILKHHFDIILVDASPLDATSGGGTLSTLVDGFIMVIKAGGLPVKVIYDAITSIPQDKFVGAILNQVKMSSNYYYYK